MKIFLIIMGIGIGGVITVGLMPIWWRIQLKRMRACEKCGGQLSEMRGWAGYAGEYGYYKKCVGDVCASAEVEEIAPGQPACEWSVGYTI